MPTIQVDPEVLAALKERGRFGDTYNGIIRDVLGLPRLPPDPLYDAHIPGALGPLLSAGLLHKGQTLTWHRPRGDETYTAAVDDQGRLVTRDGAVHRTPNTAASYIAGHPILGWGCWRTADGTTLARLRQRLPAVAAP